MGLKAYFTGKSGLIFWLNVILAIGLLVALPFITFQLLGWYTNHGEKVEVPDVRNLNAYEAGKKLESSRLQTIIADSVYRSDLKSGTVLQQMPRGGQMVKSGRLIYLTVSRSTKQPVEIPDFHRDLRNVETQLTQLGFTLTEPQLVEGEEKDLVVALKQGAMRLNVGEMVVPDRPVTIVVGAGFPEDTLDVDSFMVITEGGYDVVL